MWNHHHEGPNVFSGKITSEQLRTTAVQTVWPNFPRGYLEAGRGRAVTHYKKTHITGYVLLIRHKVTGVSILLGKQPSWIYLIGGFRTKKKSLFLWELVKRQTAYLRTTMGGLEALEHFVG